MNLILFSTPATHTDFTWFAPWIHVLTNEIHSFHASFNTLITCIDAVINNTTDTKNSTDINLLYFIFSKTICENYVIKNTWKESLNPQFRRQPRDFLTSCHHIHLVKIVSKVLHGWLSAKNWFQVKEVF